jgi:hypothetical protein
MKVIERIDDSCCRVRFKWRVRFYLQVFEMGCLKPRVLANGQASLIFSKD